MDDDGPTASIIFYVAMLLIDMFFYGFGAALDSLNEKEIERRAEEDIEGHSRDRKSIRLRAIIGNPAEYLNTVQLITTLINIVIGTVHLRLLLGVLSQGLQLVAENQFQMDKDSAGIVVAVSAVLATFLLLYITLTLGVLLPKKIGARFPEKWAYACITPIYFVTKVLSPFTGLVNLTANGILRIFGLSGNASEADVTEEEIINMVNEGHEQGLIQASEAEMISNIFEFGDKEAQDIMTYRKNILAINEDTLLRDAITFMMEGKNSRYPVYEENIDHIIGILHLKDAMRFHAGEGNLGRPLKELENLMREPVFVHRTKNIDELFRQMQAKKQQMVIVVDEYGQTDGLVAMEDILEEIVGNILDEYDEITEHIEEKGDDEYVIEGKTPLEELEERFGIYFDDEEFDVDYGGFNFRILKVENKMIQSVLVTRLPEAEPALEDSDEK